MHLGHWLLYLHMWFDSHFYSWHTVAVLRCTVQLAHTVPTSQTSSVNWKFCEPRIFTAFAEWYLHNIYRAETKAKVLISSRVEDPYFLGVSRKTLSFFNKSKSWYLDLQVRLELFMILWVYYQRFYRVLLVFGFTSKVWYCGTIHLFMIYNVTSIYGLVSFYQIFICLVSKWLQSNYH